MFKTITLIAIFLFNVSSFADGRGGGTIIGDGGKSCIELLDTRPVVENQVTVPTLSEDQQAANLGAVVDGVDPYEYLIKDLKNKTGKNKGEFKNPLAEKALEEIDAANLTQSVLRGTRPILINQLRKKRRNLHGYYSLRVEDFKSIIHFLFSGEDWVLTNTTLTSEDFLEIVDFGIELGLSVAKVKRIDLGGTAVRPGILEELYERGFRLQHFQAPATEDIDALLGARGWIDDFKEMPTLQNLDLSFFLNIRTHEIDRLFSEFSFKEITLVESPGYNTEFVKSRSLHYALQKANEIMSRDDYQDMFIEVVLKNLLSKVKGGLSKKSFEEVVELIQTRWKLMNFEWQLGEKVVAPQRDRTAKLISKFLNRKIFPDLVKRSESESTRKSLVMSTLLKNFDEDQMAVLRGAVFGVQVPGNIRQEEEPLKLMFAEYMSTKVDYFAQIEAVSFVNLSYDAVSDGDTASLSVIKNGVADSNTVRFLYIDTPEKEGIAKTEIEADMSDAAKRALIYFFSNTTKITVSSIDSINDGREGRGRYLYDVILEGPWGVRSYASLMLEAGLTIFYNGETSRPTTDWQVYYDRNPEVFNYWMSQVYVTTFLKLEVPKEYLLVPENP